jgi:hypothetical protein
MLVLDLYDSTGLRVGANQVELIQLLQAVETHAGIDVAFIRRAVHERPGRYWLVADWPLHTAMLTEIQLLQLPDNTWSASYGTVGIASTAAFDNTQLERVIEACQREAVWAEGITANPAGMPDVAARIARRVVRYRRS